MAGPKEVRSPASETSATRLRDRLRESGSALRDVLGAPQLRRAELAYALECTGEGLFAIGLGVVAFRNGGAAAVGLVALARMVPSAIASPLLTAFADRAPRLLVLRVVSVVRAVLLGAGALALHAGVSTVAVYVLAVLATIAFTVYRPTHSALLPTLCTTTRELTSANVVRGIVGASSAVIGPAFAGVLLAVSDVPLATATAAAFSLLALGVVWRIHDDTVAHAVHAPALSLGHDTAEGVRTVAGHRDLRRIFGLAFAQTAVRGALNVFTVVLALDLLETGDPGVAALSAAVGAGGLLGSIGVSLLVGSRHLGAWLAIALVLWGLPLAIVGIAPVNAVAFALFAVVGLGNAIIDVPFFTLPVRLASDAVLARVFGVFEALAALGVGVGSVLTPLLIAVAGLRGALIAAGLVLPVLAMLSWRQLCVLDERMAVREAEIEVLRHAPMLARLPVASIEHLASRMRRLDVAAHATLFAQGDPGGGFYTVVAGDAEIVGNGMRIACAGPGDSFGEIALLHDVPRTATVTAITDLTILEVERDAFLDAVGAHRPSSDAANAVVARHLAELAQRPPAPVGI